MRALPLRSFVCFGRGPPKPPSSTSPSARVRVAPSLSAHRSRADHFEDGTRQSPLWEHTRFFRSPFSAPPPGNYTGKSPAPLYRVPYILLCTFGRGTMAYGNVQIFLTVRTVTYWIFAAAPHRADIDTPTSQLRKTNLGGYGKLQLRPNSRITQLLVTSNDRQQRHRRGTHHGLPWTVGTKATDSRDLHSSRENQRVNK